MQNIGKKKELLQADNKGSKEDFDAMKKKTKKMAIALIGVIIAAIAGIAAYKYMH